MPMIFPKSLKNFDACMAEDNYTALQFLHIKRKKVEKGSFSTENSLSQQCQDAGTVVRRSWSIRTLWKDEASQNRSMDSRTEAA